MKLHELHPAEGSTSAQKRLGRGAGSGLGKTSGKGVLARSTSLCTLLFGYLPVPEICNKLP